MRTNGTNLILPNAFSSTFPAGPITLQISSKSFSCFSGLAAKWWTRNAAVEAVESIPTCRRTFVDYWNANFNETNRVFRLGFGDIMHFGEHKKIKWLNNKYDESNNTSLLSKLQ